MSDEGNLIKDCRATKDTQGLGNMRDGRPNRGGSRPIQHESSGERQKDVASTPGHNIIERGGEDEEKVAAHQADNAKD